MSTTIDNGADLGAGATRKQRRAAGIAEAASGGMKVLLLKLVMLGVVDAIAIYGLIVLASAGQWLVAGLVFVVTVVVIWFYFSFRKLPA